MLNKNRALNFGFRKLGSNPINSTYSNGYPFKYIISILGVVGSEIQESWFHLGIETKETETLSLLLISLKINLVLSCLVISGKINF